MKIYNICNTKRFFEVLSRCTGPVELVNDEGKRIALNAEPEAWNLAMLAQTYVNGVIRSMELSFVNPEDAAKMCDYLTNMKES